MLMPTEETEGLYLRACEYVWLDQPAAEREERDGKELSSLAALPWRRGPLPTVLPDGVGQKRGKGYELVLQYDDLKHSESLSPGEEVNSEVILPCSFDFQVYTTTYKHRIGKPLELQSKWLGSCIFMFLHFEKKKNK